MVVEMNMRGLKNWRTRNVDEVQDRINNGSGRREIRSSFVVREKS